MSARSERVAVITGASRGIGLATAVALTEAGVGGLVLAARQAAGLDEAVARLRPNGVPVLAVAADVSQSADVARLFAAAGERFGRVDILVCNAGLAGSKTLVAELSDETWRRCQAANLDSAFFCARAAVPGMVARRWGRIVTVASRAGLAGHTLGRAPGLSADADYASAKAGLIGLTKALAYELAPHGITANVVAPGPILTEMLRQGTTAAGLAERVALLPVGRLGQPEEVAAAIVHLTSETAGFTTGAVLNVNGGSWTG